MMSFKIHLLALVNFWVLIILEEISCTIDLNAAELQYLADHLTPEECRRLVAAAHFKSYQEPNALDQAERKISKDVSCIDLLHHWNSQPGEGKGETHEVLEHRLRQMDKYDLADWLGRTVFHDLAMDLNRSLERGLREFATESTEGELPGPTLVPIVSRAAPTEWSAMDSLLYAVMVGLILVLIALSVKLCYNTLCRYKTRKVKFKKPTYEVMGDETTDSEEDKFDVRIYSETKTLMDSPRK